MYYIMNPDYSVSPVVDVREWGKNFSSVSRHLARVRINNRLISTIFLGIDHNYGPSGPPLLFETMVFAFEKRQGRHSIYYDDLYCARYATAEDAFKGHARVVKREEKRSLKKNRGYTVYLPPGDSPNVQE